MMYMCHWNIDGNCPKSCKYFGGKMNWLQSSSLSKNREWWLALSISMATLYSYSTQVCTAHHSWELGWSRNNQAPWMGMGRRSWGHMCVHWICPWYWWWLLPISMVTRTLLVASGEGQQGTSGDGGFVTCHSNWSGRASIPLARIIEEMLLGSLEWISTTCWPGLLSLTKWYYPTSVGTKNYKTTVLRFQRCTTFQSTMHWPFQHQNQREYWNQQACGTCDRGNREHWSYHPWMSGTLDFMA